MAHQPRAGYEDNGHEATNIDLDDLRQHEVDAASPNLIGSPLSSPGEPSPVGNGIFETLLSKDDEQGAEKKPDVSVNPLHNNSSGDSSQEHGDREPPAEIAMAAFQEGQPKRFRWKYETLCLAFSAASLIAVIIMLIVFDGKPIQDWRAPVSINTAVAILSALFRGLLVLPLSSGIAQMKWISFSRKRQSFANVDTYDQASRGAWGSFILIKRQFTGERLSPIAIMGALLVLALVAAEPFSQASVMVAMCGRVHENAAWIPRASMFTGSQTLERGSVMMNSTFQLAAYQALYDDYRSTPELMQPLVNCPTGNCTFPQPVSIQTLSMCHSCRDITDKISGLPSDLNNPPEDMTLSIKGYTESFQARTLLPLVTNCSASGVLGQNEDPDATGARWPDGVWNDTSLVGFQGVAGLLKNTSCNFGNRNRKSDCVMKGYLGFDCGFRPCVKSYSSNMLNGKYTETEVDRKFLHRAPNDDFQLVLDETFINGTWTKCTSEDHWTPTHNATVGRLPPIKLGEESLYYPPSCVYSVSQADFYALVQFLQDGLFVPKTQLDWAATQDGTVEVFGQAWQAKLWNHGSASMDVTNRFAEGLANVLGNYIRANGATFYQTKDIGPDFNNRFNTTIFPADWTRALGDAHYDEACIQVRWRYMAYPATLFLLVLVFFVAVVWDDYKSKSWGADWKLATLPMLFPALRNRPTSVGSKMQSKSYYNEAQPLQVKLVSGDDGWVFTSGRDEIGHQPVLYHY